MEHDPEGCKRLHAHKRRRDVELEIEEKGASVARETEGGLALQERQDVEMPVEAIAESASVKRGSDAVADNEERARLRFRAEGKRGQKHDMQDVLEPQAKTRARLEPRRGQKRESTQPLPELEEEVASIIQGGSSSSADVPVDSSVATSVNVEDMVQTYILSSTSVGTQPANARTNGTLCLNESKAKDFEKLTNLVLTSKSISRKTHYGIDARSRENLLGDVCSRSGRRLLARNFQRTFSAAWF